MLSRMKVLPLVLVSVLGYAQCFHLIMETNYICPTFPYCFQDLTTGVWKSPLGPVSNTANLTKSKETDHEPTECWKEGFFCRSDASNLIETVDSETAEDCFDDCFENEGCEHFSFHVTRGQGHCSLQSSCQVTSPCTEEEYCVAGLKTCACPPLKYLPGTKEDNHYARWTCPDIDPYSSSTPVGTTCTASCSAWAESPLQSTCQRNGKWTPTVASSAGRSLLTYTAAYPTPEQPDMVCGCQEVGPFMYDPNDEDGAEFVCQGWEPERFKSEEGWTIKTSDRCELFCSNEPQPVTTVMCEGDTWQGQPELGFWCYHKHENIEPLGQESEKPLQYKIQRCDSTFVQGGFECEQAFDGDITKVHPRDPNYILGWAYLGKIPSSVIFYLEGSVSINTIIFKTALNRRDHHLDDFAIDVLVDNEFKPVDITRVNVANSKIDGNKVQTNGEMNIRVAFNTMNKVSAIKLHAYGSDAGNENSVINEIYVLRLKDKNLLWFEDDVDAILNLL